MEFIEGKVVELSQTIGMLAGMRVKMIRKSRRTSNITVEAVEARGTYVIGQRLHVHAYELRECEKRPTELERDYAGACDYAIRWLNTLVEHGKAARNSLIAKLKQDNFEALTYEVKWGHGVKEDIMRGLADHTLVLAQQDGILYALQHMKTHCEAQLLNNSNRGGSSSDYSNAVDATRNVCLSDFARSCGDRAAWISDARAEMEVL